MSLGRTNVPMFTSGGGVNLSGEVTLPTPLSSLSITPGVGKVTLKPVYASTAYVTGIVVKYKTGSYPISVSDGNGVTVTEASTSIAITGLTNGVTYYFRVFLYNEVDGGKYYQTSTTNAQVSGIPVAAVPPTYPSAISAAVDVNKVTLKLSYSSTTNLSGVVVRYQTGSYPSSATSGTGKTVTGAPTSIDITGLTGGTKYYFRVFPYNEVDSVKYYQTSTTNSQITATPVAIPSTLSSISYTAGNGQVTLNISYSSTANVSGVEVRYQTGNYPSSVTSGNGKTVTGTPTSITITGLTNDTTYYFRVFPYNEVNGTRYYQTSTTNARTYATPYKPVPTISGIAITKRGSNYFLIANSGSFTLTIPNGMKATAYLAGGGCNGEFGISGDEDNGSGNGGNGGYGGYSLKYTKYIVAGTYSCTSSIGAVSTKYNDPTNTTFQFGSTTLETNKYQANTTMHSAIGGYGHGVSGDVGTDTPYGYIGSGGGGGGSGDGNQFAQGGYGGSGAGNGGNGGTSGRNGTSATNGTNATNYGCGGGGGGGGSFDCNYGNDSAGNGGNGKKGCIIIAW